MRFAKLVFLLSAIYGVLALVPMYFMERWIGVTYPPPITHPEHYYGFVGVGLAWQLLFFVIASDPLRMRPAMLPAIAEKLAWGIATAVLFAQGRVPGSTLAVGCFDLFLGALFFLAWRATRQV